MNFVCLVLPAANLRHKVEPVGIGFGVLGDFFEDVMDADLWCPLPYLCGEGGVEDHPRDIEGTGRRRRGGLWVRSCG